MLTGCSSVLGATIFFVVGFWPTTLVFMLAVIFGSAIIPIAQSAIGMCTPGRLWSVRSYCSSALLQPICTRRLMEYTSLRFSLHGSVGHFYPSSSGGLLESGSKPLACARWSYSRCLPFHLFGERGSTVSGRSRRRRSLHSKPKWCH